MLVANDTHVGCNGNFEVELPRQELSPLVMQAKKTFDVFMLTTLTSTKHSPFKGASKCVAEQFAGFTFPAGQRRNLTKGRLASHATPAAGGGARHPKLHTTTRHIKQLFFCRL